MRPRLPRSRWGRFLATLPFLVGAIALLVWRAPDWGLVADAFTLVSWRWVVAAIALNLLSVVARALAWRTVIDQALPPPQLPFRRVFSAFGVGLFANAVLPGRIGELARVAVLTRRLERKREAGATLVGTVFAHRVFDLFPSLLLIGYVLASARIPHWALTSLVVFVAVGIGLFAFAVASARRGHRSVLEEVGQARQLDHDGALRARRDAGAHCPRSVAIFFQTVGWAFQLAAVWAVMMAFEIHEPLHAAALVLLLMNIATLLPLWPGNIGLVQAAVALPLVSYGVAYSRGFAFGIGLQVIEVAVGVGVGLLFLAREGLSFAMLKTDARGRRGRGGAGGRAGPARGAARVLALASPASLKEVLKPVEAALALAAGLREGGAEAWSCRSLTAGRGRLRCIAAARQAGGGRRRSQARWASACERVISCWRMDLRWSRLRRRSGCGLRSRARSARRLEPGSRRADARGRGGDERPDPHRPGRLCDGRRRRGATGGRRRRSCAARAFARPATCGTRCSGSAVPLGPSARRRVRRLRWWKSWSAGWRRWSSSGLTRTCPAQVQPVGSARRSRL